MGVGSWEIGVCQCVLATTIYGRPLWTASNVTQRSLPTRGGRNKNNRLDAVEVARSSPLSESPHVTGTLLSVPPTITGPRRRWDQRARRSYSSGRPVAKCPVNRLLTLIRRQGDLSKDMATVSLGLPLYEVYPLTFALAPRIVQGQDRDNARSEPHEGRNYRAKAYPRTPYKDSLSDR